MSSDNKLEKIKNQSAKKTPRALASGTLKIGNINIDCAILDDGSQVITRNSILKFMGRSNGGGKPTKEILALRESGIHIPVFVAANNLIPFIPKTLSSSGQPLLFIPLRGGKATGYPASIIPDICDTYLEARKAGEILTKNQAPIAATLEIIARGLARVGLTALINEACGIVTNEKDYLQKILNEYVEKLILPWAKRFPKSFFTRYKRLYGLTDDKSIPMHIGHFINTYIYKELHPHVLEELQKLNPINEKGRRPHAHHQFLTPNKGVIALEKQVIKVNTLMGIVKDKKEFIEYYEKNKAEEDE